MLKNKILCGLVSIVLATGLYAEEQKQIDYEYQMIQNFNGIDTPRPVQ